MVQVALPFPEETYVLAVDYLISKIGVFNLRLRQVYFLLDVAVIGPFLYVPESLFAVFGFACAGAWACVHPFQLPSVDIADTLGFGIVIIYPFLAFFQEIHVVALVDIDAAPVHFHDRIAYAVQEIAVVSYHEKSASAMLQMRFQKLDGVYVQMVGGLVHYVEIGLRSQHPGKGYALDFAARKIPHRLIRIIQAELSKKLIYTQFILP